MPQKKVIKKKPLKKVVKKAAVKKVAAKKKAVAKKVVKKEKLVGQVVHYFDHIKVAVIKLKSPLAVGDEISLAGGQDTDFKQKIQSMEVEHQKITKAKKGQEIGMKVKEKVRDGYKVFKV